MTRTTTICLFSILPIELALNILSIAITASSSSQLTYRTLLLVSRQFHKLVKLECLRFVPITLEGFKQLRSFYDLLLSSEQELHKHIRHLWIIGDDCRMLISCILTKCTSITNLACTSYSLAISICSSESFHHLNLTHLTLVDTHPLNHIMHSKWGDRVCAQITHLRIHEELSLQFPYARLRPFGKLTHLSFSWDWALLRHLEKHLNNLDAGLRVAEPEENNDVESVATQLKRIVITTYWWWAHPPMVGELLERDERLAVVQCMEMWTELGAWQESVRGGVDLWEEGRRGREVVLKARQEGADVQY
jgi:hypothetical protein